MLKFIYNFKAAIYIIIILMYIALIISVVLFYILLIILIILLYIVIITSVYIALIILIYFVLKFLNRIQLRNYFNLHYNSY